jgi:hypothetical protein
MAKPNASASALNVGISSRRQDLELPEESISSLNLLNK